jgi:hypothetical protein
MATTPATSISSSYQRLGGSTPVITQGSPGPQLSAATQERLRLAEEGKLDEERRAANLRMLQGLSPLERSEVMKKQADSEMKANKAAYDRMNAEKNPFAHFRSGPGSKYSPKPGDFSYTFKGV